MYRLIPKVSLELPMILTACFWKETRVTEDIPHMRGANFPQKGLGEPKRSYESILLWDNNAIHHVTAQPFVYAKQCEIFSQAKFNIR